jgi:exopolyphosphatase / guanosine-5'-triphosphate,3'-diphosphate pyrophosphatase
MRVAVIDVGSNTARLLVADVERGAVRTVAEGRAYLRLGPELAGGLVSSAKLAEVAAAMRRFRQQSARFSVVREETIVTAPGRHGAASEPLLQTLREASRGRVRVLSADEEARLAFGGAVARAERPPEVVGVVDVGGGSSEVAVGTPLLGPAWVRSYPTGSLQVTSSWLHGDPPTRAQVDAARDDVRRRLADCGPPRPDGALATGGTARALARVLGRRYGRDELDEAVALLASRPTHALVRAFGVHPHRARTLVAGTIVLADLADRLGTSFDVSRGGLREGAALTLAAAEAVAA